MERLRRMVLSLLTIMISILVLPRHAFAQGDHPIEGKHYWLVAPNRVNSQVAEGLSIEINPDWTYVRIAENANLHTPELVRQLKTDMFSLRADNPYSTLALCEVSKNNWERDRTAGVNGRPSQNIWKRCSDDKKYVYVVPGTVLVLKGRKHLTPSETADVQAKLDGCTTSQCACENVKFFAQGVTEWNCEALASGSVTSPPTLPSTSTPPGIGGPSTPSGGPAPPSVTPTGTDTTVASTTSQENVFFWLAIALGAVIIALLIVSAVQSRRLQDIRSRCDRLVVDNASMEMAARKTWTAFHKLVFGSDVSETQVQGMNGARFIGYVRSRVSKHFEDIAHGWNRIAQAAQLAIPGGGVDGDFITLIEKRIMKEMIPLKDHHDLVGNMSDNSRTLEGERDEAQSKLGQMTATAQHWRDQFISLVADVHRAVTGQAPSNGLLTSSPDEQIQLLLRTIHLERESIDELAREILLVVDADVAIDERGRTRTMLEQIRADMLHMSAGLNNMLERVAEKPEMGSIHDQVEFLVLQCTVHAGPCKVPESGFDASSVSLEAIRHLDPLTQLTILRDKVPSLDRQIASLRDQIARHEEKPPETQDGIGPRAIQGSSEGVQEGEHAIVDTPESEAPPEGQPLTGNTLFPGRMSTSEDTRSPARQRAFAGCNQFADLFESFAVAQIEHPSEVPTLRRISQSLRRKFQLELSNGETVTFSPKELLKDGFWQRLNQQIAATGI